MKLVAWVDSEGCLDTECNAVGNRTWDSRAVYCSEECLIADGHKNTSMLTENSHILLGVYGVELEPGCCEHCASCLTKVIQGVECRHECDDECISIFEREVKA